MQEVLEAVVGSPPGVVGVAGAEGMGVALVVEGVAEAGGSGVDEDSPLCVMDTAITFFTHLHLEVRDGNYTNSCEYFTLLSVSKLKLEEWEI